MKNVGFSLEHEIIRTIGPIGLKFVPEVNLDEIEVR